MNNKPNLIDEGSKEFSLVTTLNMVQHGAKELLNGHIPEIASEGIASLLPGAYGVYTSVKRKKFEDNLLEAFEQLQLKQNVLRDNFNKKSVEQKNQLDKIYGLILDYAIEETQTDKIAFIINGFESLSYYTNISEDFVLTYYDVLKSLRLVDISTLKVFDNRFINKQDNTTKLQVLEKHNITSGQYKSVKENLLRYGLLTTQVDLNNFSDTEKLYGLISEIQKYLKDLADPKKKNLPKLTNPKFKTKDDRYNITSFGKEFLDFFNIKT